MRWIELRTGRRDHAASARIADSRPGVEAVVDRLKAVLVDMGVDLGGGDVGVAEHLLDDA